LREVRDGGRRNRPGQHHAAAHRADASGERCLQHVPGEARVLADHDPWGAVAVPPRDVGERTTEAYGELGRHRSDVRAAADAVRPEILTFLRHGGSGSRPAQSRKLMNWSSISRPSAERKTWIAA